MNNPITVIPMTILLITHCGAHPTSICDSNKDFSDNHPEITSTNDFLELNHKSIDFATDDAVPHDPNRVEHNGFVYYSDNDGLFVQPKNSTRATQIDGFTAHTSIWLDANHNLLYFGTNNGLWTSECGGRKANKIGATDGIDVDFGVIDDTGNVYFGNDGANEQLMENMYLLKKADQQRLIRIGGIEQSSFGSYTLENLGNPNKIAVDRNNNIYVGAYTGYIYVIEPGQATAIKLKDIKSGGGVTSIVADSKDNVYFRTNNALYGLKSGGRELTKIVELVDDFDYSLWLDGNDNLYFKFLSKTYVLQPEAVAATEINTISNSNDISATAIDLNNLQNFQVKNKINYFTSSSKSNGKEVIVALRPNETSLRLLHTTDGIISLAVDNSNNIYFVTFSTDLQKYAPFVLRPNDGGIPIEIRGVTGHLSHVFSDNQNNIFFGSGNGLHVLQNDEVTPFKIGATESQISTFVVDRNDNVYFGTDYDGAFVLKAGLLEAIRIEGINAMYGSYVEVYGDKKVDVIYFKTGGALYKLNGGETSVIKIVEGYSPNLFLTNCMYDTTFYVQSDDGISSILAVNDEDGQKTTAVTEIAGEVLRIVSDNFNNLFFTTDTNQLHIVRPKQVKSEVIANDTEFTSLNVDRDNDVYFTTAKGDAYVIRSGEIEPTNIKNISGDFKYFVTNGDDILFVTAKNSNEAGLFLIRNKMQFESAAFANRDLGRIDNSDDETIFNMLNYLNRNGNYLLSKSKNKIINKTPTSATVVATNGKFKGSFNVSFIVTGEDEENVKNLHLIDLLKRAVFFEHVAKNSYDFRNKKIIRDISISAASLTFFPVDVTTKSELPPIYEFKNICFSKKRIANPSPLPQTVKVEECTYETKETISFRITVGLNKTDSEVKDSMDSILNSVDEDVLLNSFSVYGNSQSDAPAKIALSDDFDLSNLNQHSHEVVLHTFREKEQEIIVPPKQRTLINYSVRTFVLETMLNLQQKIKGRFVGKISYTDSEELIQMTIKEAMQMLRKYKLIPSEITINQDNSIMFNGKGMLNVKRESDPKIIRNFYDL